MNKKVLISLFLLVSLALIGRIPMIQYAWMQGSGQWRILREAVTFETYLESPLTAKDAKDKLELVQNAIAFADSLGLKTDKAYTTIYDQQGEDVLWNVSACEPFAFNSYRWRFPLLGSFSYKGFFDLEEAKLEAKRLKEKGLDVRIRPVGAWSTLGWFEDPLMSKQLEKSVGSIAETLFHELTHATIFYPDSLEYNENLASFIGQSATLDFLILQYGVDSKELKDYSDSNHDSQLFRLHMFKGKEQLKTLYDTFHVTETDSSKFSLKTQMITEMIQGLDSLNFKNPRYRALFKQNLPNNAYFMGIDRYHGNQVIFDQIYRSQQYDLKKTIAYLKSQVD